MKFLVLGTAEQCTELQQDSDGIEWINVNDSELFSSQEGINAYFNLRDDAFKMDYRLFDKPVFVNSVYEPLSLIKSNENVIRINGWPGFLKRNVWEVAGTLTTEASEILQVLKKEFIVMPDEPGFVAARVIAMIINEAYFAKMEGVSTEHEIDIAMKLGTNYPNGPFEWANMIGRQNIYKLLKKLSDTDERYLPNKLLQSEATSLA